jgi:uncharacterized membrane protein YfcA
MQVYLPIAEISSNPFLLVFIGGAVGFLSGMFGIGGGFLLTPLLTFIGIPPAIAAPSGASQIVASSVSGALTYWRRRALDVRLGLVLVGGGFVGVLIGIFLFKYLRSAGLIDLVISLIFVVFLGSVGSLMLFESVRAIIRSRGAAAPPPKAQHHSWLHGLPLKMRFPQSRLYTSAIPPLLLGGLVGLLASIAGIGGAFVFIPAMIYLLRVPTNVVIGTVRFPVIVIMALTTLLQSAANHTVDIVLAFFLMIGGVIGAQIGASIGQRMRADHLRAILALILLAVGARLLADLTVRPADVYSISLEAHQ